MVLNLLRYCIGRNICEYFRSHFLFNLTILFAHLCDAFVHVFKIDAKNVILNDLRVEVLDNVLMLELLVPLDLLLHRFDLLLI